MQVYRVSIPNLSKYNHLTTQQPAVQNHRCKPTEPDCNISFKDRRGAIIGGLIGTAAAIGSAVFIAPLAIGAMGVSAIAGALGGYIAEDEYLAHKVNKKND